MVDSKAETKAARDLYFKHLPSFAAYILEHKLDDYSRLMLQCSRAENVPILKLFRDFTEDQLIELGKSSGAELLTRLKDNKAREHIDISIQQWISNRLESVDRDAIVAEDIALISFVRREVFRQLLKDYAKELIQFPQVMEEVDRFTTATDIAGFNAYMTIHQGKIQRMNEELTKQRQELLEAQELAQMGSFYWDLQGTGNSVFTPMVFEIFEMEGTSNLDSFLQDVHPEDRDRVKKALKDAFENDGKYECDYRYIRNNKNKRIWSRGLVTFENGKPKGMQGTIMDTTVETELLERLKESEKLHNQAQALTHIGNWSWHILTNEISWSDEMYRIYGLMPQSEKITFDRFISLVHPDSRQSRLKEIQKCLDTGVAEDYVLRIITDDGKEKILEGKGELMKDATGKPIALNGTCQDVTIEYQLNQALREQEQNLALLINNAPDAIIVIDERSIIQLWNPKTAAVFGWPAEEVVGRHLAETIIPERYREAHNRGMEHYLSTGEGSVINRTSELIAVNKENKELSIALTISETTQNGRRSFIAFIRDVTTERQTQNELRNKSILLEQKNRELEHSNEELESFNYAASHDLQEPLRKVQTYAHRATEDPAALTPKLQAYIEKISASATRMQSLINDLLLYSQTTGTDESAEEVNMNLLLEDVKNHLALQIEETGANIIHTNLPAIRVVAFQFRQVMLNLVGNAIKYKKPGLSPEIWIGASVVSNTELSDVGVQAGNYLKISVADKGIGFDPQFSNRLFELFARLHNKEKYPGTGIGLAICKKIVRNHQGFIRAESDGENGSSFHIYLPADRIVENSLL